jgi:hypothetical protein
MNKKLLALTLVLALVFSLLLVSCASEKEKELTELANTDRFEYAKSVTRYASDAAADSLNATRVLNEILPNSKITVETGTLLGEQIKSVTAYISDKKAYLSIVAPDKYEGQQFDVFAADEYLVLDLTKVEGLDNGVYKVSAAELIKGLREYFRSYTGREPTEPIELDLKDESAANEFIERFTSAIEDTLNSDVATEKIDAYGKSVKCIHTTETLNNAGVEKLINSMFDLFKDYVKGDTLPEEVKNYNAQDLIDLFNQLGVVFTAKTDDYVDAETGLPVRSIFTLDFAATPESSLDLDIQNAKILMTLNYPEDCKLTNNADMTIQLETGNTKMNAAVKWIVDKTDDEFHGKLVLSLPAVITGSQDDITAFKVDYIKSTKALTVKVIDQYTLNALLDYNDVSVALTLVSFEDMEYDYDHYNPETYSYDKILVTHDLGNIKITVEKCADFPKEPENAQSVTFEELKNLFK